MKFTTECFALRITNKKLARPLSLTTGNTGFRTQCIPVPLWLSSRVDHCAWHGWWNADFHSTVYGVVVELRREKSGVQRFAAASSAIALAAFSQYSLSERS